MSAYLLYIVAALYLGVLTSISPCPLATNIAAVSYVGRKVGDSRWVLTAGLLYTAGRCLLYLVLAVFLATTAMSIDVVARFLQNYMHLVLGPIFLLLGMFLVGLIVFAGGGASMSEKMQ
jgi:cytochrome c-type biogenesis protein